MDPERLKQKGIEKGLITAEKAIGMTPHEAYQLVCAPGFSTAATVTDISGRGVGMDAVRATVHALSGVLTIHSQNGQGSRFVMRLPITVSIIHALIVQCGPFEIAFPLNVVMRTVELKRSEIREEPDGSYVLLEDTIVPIRSLRQILNMPTMTASTRVLLPVVVCDAGGSMVALSVDHISGQQEIFVRPLRSPLSHLRGVSGATIAGDGRVLFVADVSALT
jgi:two-component system chemotaxis sensor kinase CheA